jgi:hypothetical protein
MKCCEYGEYVVFGPSAIKNVMQPKGNKLAAIYWHNWNLHLETNIVTITNNLSSLMF